MASTTRLDKDAIKLWREKCKLIFDSTAVNPFETEATQKERIARAKKDYAFFKSYYLPHYATSGTPQYQIKSANKIRKNKRYKGWRKWGRGLAKSVESIVSNPLWLWIQKDIKFMVVVGQNEDKAKLLLGDIKAEFESNRRLKHDFGVQKTNKTWQDGLFMTENGFVAKAIGMGQDPRGLRVVAQRPDYIVCDDWETQGTEQNPKRQKKIAKWLLRSVIPTMDDGNRRVILCNNHFTPVMIFSLIIEGNKNWDVDQVNAYDPVTHKPTWHEKYSPTHYREIEEEIGTLAALAEYNNSPHIEGSIFTDEMIQWTKIPKLNHLSMIAGFWDVAYGGSKTSDYNAIRVWGEKDSNFYYVDGFVKQSKMKAALLWMANFQKILPESVRVHWRFESQFWNDEVKRTIKEVEDETKTLLNLVKSDKPSGSKYDRLLSMVPYYQNNRMYYNEKLKSQNDTQVGLAQLKGIEPGYKTHDDAPDADEQCVKFLSKHTEKKKHTHRTGKRESRKY